MNVFKRFKARRQYRKLLKRYGVTFTREPEYIVFVAALHEDCKFYLGFSDRLDFVSYYYAVSADIPILTKEAVELKLDRVNRFIFMVMHVAFLVRNVGDEGVITKHSKEMREYWDNDVLPVLKTLQYPHEKFISKYL